jgi:hypothetical protein
VAVVIVAFALGVFLLNVGSRPPVSTAGTTTPTTAGTTTTTAPGSSTTTGHGSSTTTTAHGSSTTAPRTTTTAHSGSHHGTTSTTATTVPHASVAVLVANGTTTANQASDFSSALSGQGWNTLPPVDTTSPVAASAVYYASGQRAAALEVAQYIGVKATSVLPLTTAVPVESTTGADVVVVIGPDLVNKAPAAAT